MATESNEAVLFEGLFEQAKRYRAQRDALLLAAERFIACNDVDPKNPSDRIAETKAFVALRAAVAKAKEAQK